MASSTFACLPDSLDGPAPRPLRSGEFVAVWRSVLRRAQLDEVDDLEAVATQETDPIAIAKMELHRLVVLVRPLEPMHVEVITQELGAGRDAVLVGRRQHQEGAVDKKDEGAAGA